jgi:hypothetical protein
MLAQHEQPFLAMYNTAVQIFSLMFDFFLKMAQQGPKHAGYSNMQ